MVVGEDQAGQIAYQYRCGCQSSTILLNGVNGMNELETKDAVEILLSEKKKAEANLEKAYDSYCLFPNEHDQEDWDNYSALVAALEMAVDALEKQIPKKPIYSDFDDNGNDEIIPYKAICPICKYEFEFGTWNEEENHHCICGQSINWHR